MTTTLFVLVLFSAVLHAGWNALVKVGGDALVRLAMINLTVALLGLLALPFVPLPPPASWPYIGASLALHIAYYVLLARGYQLGDLSLVYPVARGLAPLWVTLGAWFSAGERPDALGFAAIALLSLSVLTLARGAGRGLPVALACGLTIAAYSVADGLGSRAAGEALYGYIAWLFVLDALPVTLLAAARRRGLFLQTLRRGWRAGLLAGVCCALAYGIVIWAMAQAPLGYVSALRETSVVFAAWIGTRLLGEPFAGRRLLSAAGIVGGALLLHFAG